MPPPLLPVASPPAASPPPSPPPCSPSPPPPFPPAPPGGGYVTLVGFAVVLDLQISEIDIEQIMGTMEDSVLQYGAELQDIHVHGILDSSGLQVSGTSEAATRVEGYVTVNGVGSQRAARADSMASALTALFAQCQLDPAFSRDVLGTVVLQVLAAPVVMRSVLYSPPPAPPPPAQKLNLGASPLPPAAPSPPSPPRPPLPLSVKAVVLTLTASGAVSDYADTSALRGKFATATGVDTSAVTITVESASVIITATIAVPASSPSVTVASVSIALRQNFGSASAATENLGIPVESAPILEVVDIAPPPAPPPPRIYGGTQDTTAEKKMSTVMQAAIVVLVLAILLLIGVCVTTKLKRRRSFNQGRRTYLRGGPDTNSFTATDDHRRGDLSARSDSEMLGGSGNGIIKRSSSGLAHLDVEVDMDAGAKGGDREYADNFSPDPSYNDRAAARASASPEDDEQRSGKYTERIQRARSLKPMMYMDPAAGSTSRSPPQDVPGWGSSSPIDAPGYPLNLPMEIGGGNIMRLETGSADNSPRPPTQEKAAAPLAYRAAPVLQAGSAHGANGAGEVNLLHDEWMASLTTIAAPPPAALPPPTQGRGAARGQLDDDDPFESAGHLRL